MQSDDLTETDDIGLELTWCPRCGAPAEVVDRTVLPSTSGPVEHLKIRCAERHWFFLPADALAEPQSGAEAA